MQVQTVFRAGNSNVVAIPRELADEYGFEPGLKVMVNPFYDGNSLVIKKVNKIKSKKTAQNVSSEFKKWLDNTLEEDSKILDGLA